VNKQEGNPILEHLKLLKKHGRLDERAFIEALDVLTEPENKELLNEYMSEQAPVLMEISMNAKPFECPDSSVDGPIRICVADNKQAVGFDPEKELHMLIAGEPGTGKTTVANYLIAPQAIKKGIKCWFFVKARDTEKLIKFNKNIVTFDFDEQLKINPLQSPKNVSRAEWDSMLWDMFIQAEAVFDGTKNFLIEQSHELSVEYGRLGAEPGMFELHDYIKEREFPRMSRNSHYQESALNRLGGILKGPLSAVFDCSSGCLEELVNENVIFYIGGLPTTQQVFIVNVLIGWLFAYKKNNYCDERHFVIIDDAMLVFDASFEKRPDRGLPVINHFLAEVRKTKINMIVLVQFPSLIGQGIYGTSSVKMMFTLSDSKDTDRMLDSMGEHDRERREFARNISKEGREAIVKFSSRYTKPFLGAVPILPGIERLDEIVITKEEKWRNNAQKIYLFQSIKPRTPYRKEEDTENQEKDNEILKIAKDILNDVYNRPFINSTDRAYDFKLSNDKAKRVYHYIESEGFVEQIFLNLSGRGGKSKFYWLTDKGYRFIQKPKKPEGSGGKGVEHIFIQEFLKDELGKKGYKNIEIEKLIDGKRIDLFCEKDGKSLGIEICISTFKTEYLNVLKDMGKCDRIVIVCTDIHAKKKLVEEFEQGSLIKEFEVYVLHEFLKEF